MTSSRPAVLFDIDGTLLDTNWFHAVSWWFALREVGEDIAMARIHPLIGMGSDQLLVELLGEERDGLSDLHAKYYTALRVRPPRLPERSRTAGRRRPAGRPGRTGHVIE